MNKTEKTWVAILVALLIGYLAWQWTRPTPPPAPAPAPVAQQTSSVNTNKAATISQAAPAQTPAEAPLILPKGEDVVLENDQVKLTFNTLGARLLSAEMKLYKAENTEDSGPVVMQTGDLLELSFGEALPQLYTVTREGQTLHFVTTLSSGVELKRSITLEHDYKLTVKDAFSSATPSIINAYRFNGGTLSLIPKDELGADLLAQGERKPEYMASELPRILGAGSAFLGCGTSTDAAGTRESAQQAFPAQTWVALKNRFFVSLVQPQTACPVDLRVAREKGDRLVVNRVGADFSYPSIALGAGQTQEVWTTLYVGPKKLSSLNAFGNHADRVMDFGFFTWVCEILLPLLNGFYWIIPNYGVAIILLTFVVRMVFWPLTHKSTVSMRKMSIIQPMIKDLQKQFKDNPQKLQQETFKLYREHKVNPFSSCLPLLIQIPIFIALF
ncbi:MAG: membrane protein insertase YidC, partial [Elusimicrobiales bacterium]|nr:membrane protein insertase YidC [Elusimicrobiales bacterium]